ncbi:MAG: ATP-binding protein [Ignavibacteria bacterium]
MKLKPRFIIGYLAISIIVFFVGLLNYLQLKKIHNSLEEATGKYAPTVIEIGRMQYIGTRMREEAVGSALLQMAAINFNKEFDFENIDEENEEFEQNYEQLQNQLTNLKNRDSQILNDELSNKLNIIITDIFTSGKDLINIGFDEERLREIETIKESIEVAEEQFIIVTNELISKYQSKFENSRLQGLENLNQSIIIGWSGIIAAILMSIILGSVGSNRIVNPLLNLISATQDIPKGNYEIKQIKMPHDEVSHLYKSFIIMADALREKTNSLLKEIKVREESEKQTDALNKKMESKNKELEQIIYGVSHDLRSPLINITGFSSELKQIAEILKYEVNADASEIDKEKINKTLEEEFTSFIEFIQMSAKKIDTVLKSLLQLARLGNLMPSFEKLDMNDVINDVNNSFGYQIKEKNINVIVEKLLPCFANKNIINPLFANLIGNAIKYSDEEKESFVKISGYVENQNSVYVIEDNGIGIAEENIPKIFDIFYRGKKSGKDGFGIGLAIVKRIVELNKGKIWVESNVGEGSKFYVSIPNSNWSI